MAKAAKKTHYGWSTDSEIFHDCFDSREAAIKAAVYEHGPEVTVYTCECVYPDAVKYARLPGMCGEDFATAIEEAANDDGIGFENGPVFEIDERELEDFLLEALKMYLRVARFDYGGYMPANIEEHKPAAAP